MAYPRTGLCLFVFCCRQAVTKRPSNRAQWPYMVWECEEGLLLAQERKGGLSGTLHSTESTKRYRAAAAAVLD